MLHPIFFISLHLSIVINFTEGWLDWKLNVLNNVRDTLFVLAVFLLYRLVVLHLSLNVLVTLARHYFSLFSSLRVRFGNLFH